MIFSGQVKIYVSFVLIDFGKEVCSFIGLFSDIIIGFMEVFIEDVDLIYCKLFKVGSIRVVYILEVDGYWNGNWSIVRVLF